MIVPQPVSFQMTCDDDQPLEQRRAGHDVDGWQADVPQDVDEDARPAEHLLEERRRR